MVAYIPISLKARLRKARELEGTSYTRLVLAAVDASHVDLASRWAPTRPTGGSAFIGWQKSRQQHDEQVVPITLRLVQEDEDTLDDLWEEAGAPSRSAYVVAALNNYLPS